MTKARIQVNLKTFQRRWRLDRPAITRFVEKVWSRLVLARLVPQNAVLSEVTVVFLNNPRIQWYNRVYRSKDTPTDVLSFPVNEVTVEESHYLGDILISVEKAAAQAGDKNHSLSEELQILLLHGMIHSIGFDHENDSGEMNRLEKRLRRQLITRRILTL